MREETIILANGQIVTVVTNNNELDKQVENFLSKWSEMMDAANAIDGFIWDFDISIQTDDSLLPYRIKAIDGINKSFEDNNMNYSSRYVL